MKVILSDRITLTDENAASNYGIPVAVINGKAHGPGDQVGSGGHAADFVQAASVDARLQGKITTEQLEWCSRFWQ